MSSGRVCGWALLVAVLPAVAVAERWIHGHGVLSVRSGTLDGRAPVEKLEFAWTPGLRPSRSVQILSARCLRKTDREQLMGRNRVTFKRIDLLGVRSGARAVLAAKGRKMLHGFADVVWDVTDLVRERFRADPFVLVEGEIAIGGTIGERDVLLCELQVSESRGSRAPAARRASSQNR